MMLAIGGMSDGSLIAVLAIAGLVMIISEFVLPGAILGILGAIAIVVSVVLTMTSGELTIGLGTRILVSAGIIVAAIALILLWMRFFHLTFVGRKLTLNSEVGGTAEIEARSELVDQTGTVASELRPAGSASIGGKKYEVRSEGDIIEKGEAIRVAKVDGAKIIVRRA